jgi:hypothetical protein
MDQVAKTCADTKAAAGHNLSPQTSAKGDLLGPQRFQCPSIERIPFFKDRKKISPGPQNVALP